MEGKAKKDKTCSISPSRVVPHRSTTDTRGSLTSLFGWEAVTLPDVAARDYAMIFVNIYSIANLMHSSIRTISLLSVLATRWSVCVSKLDQFVAATDAGAATSVNLLDYFDDYMPTIRFT